MGTISTKVRDVKYMIKGMHYRALYGAMGPLKHEVNLRLVNQSDIFSMRDLSYINLEKVPEILITISELKEHHVPLCISQVRLSETTINANQKGNVVMAMNYSAFPEDVTKLIDDTFDLFKFEYANEWHQIGVSFPIPLLNIQGKQNHMALFYGELVKGQKGKMRLFRKFYGHECPRITSLYVFNNISGIVLPPYTPVQTLDEKEQSSSPLYGGSSGYFKFPLSDPGEAQDIRKILKGVEGESEH